MKIYYALATKLTLLLLFSLASSQTSIAQRSIEGKVTDANGEALIGATILVKGTTIGTITDIDGSYEITLPADQNIIQISYTGYAEMEVDMTGRNNYVVTLAEDDNLLDEVGIHYPRNSCWNFDNA